MLNIKPLPSFERFLDTLYLRAAWRRPPLFDFHVAACHKHRILGREIVTPADEVEFWVRAGYDYVQCTLHAPAQELADAIARDQGGASTHSSEQGIITDLQQFQSRRWSWQDAAEGNLAGIEPQFERLLGVIQALPAEMKIVLHNADVFTDAWQMTGFTRFCLMSVEQPELIRAIMDSLAAAQLNVTRRAAELAGRALGALFYSDDIAYTEGLMLGPQFFADHLFPTIERFGRIAPGADVPLIYHTDGRLYQVFDQLAGIGVRGVQPLEPKSMDPLEIKRRWPGKFCLLGNIDLDLLVRGDRTQVDAHVRNRIDTLNVGGGYMPGVSNTVPYYVRSENYEQMIETVYSYPAERIL